MICKLLRKRREKRIKNVKINIFDYYEVMKERPYWEETIVSNGIYGTSYCLKRYTGYPKMIQCAIEHGMPHTFENEYELNGNKANTLLVASEERKKALKGYTNKNIIPYGPLIAYSKVLFDDNTIRDMKDNLGKTLLVYPMHSIEDYHFKNSTNDFIDFVEEIKKKYNYDTVLVSIYFIDILRGFHVRFMQRGWKIMCAGNRLNFDFMDCQRTIMELADLVVCQGYSSALGYAGYLKKPIVYKDLPLIVRHNGEIEEQDMWMQYKNSIIELFSDYHESLTEEQYEFLSNLYGYDSVMSPEELRNIFKMSEKRNRWRIR